MQKNKEQIQAENKQIKIVTVAGMAINIFLTFLKIIIGYIGKSQSVIADGIHSLSDCTTDIAVLVGLKYWNQPPDECHPYGHRRIETMTAVLIGVFLAGAGIFLCWEAIEKFHEGNFVVPASITLIAAVVSILVKEILFHWTIKVSKKVNSPALRANAWHHRTDSLSSIGVALAISVSLYNPEWAILDPIAAFAVGIFIIQAAYKIVNPAIEELSDRGATPEQIEEIQAIVLKVEGVRSIHALRTRFLGSGLQVDMHVQVEGNLTVLKGHEIAGHAKRHLLEDGPAIIDVLIHIEPFET